MSFVGLSVRNFLSLNVVLLSPLATCDPNLRSRGGVRDDCGGEVGERISSPMGEENGIRGICGGARLSR